uniref:Putative ribonuclease H-like domain-containing protein n=1 Tax=Tanacetum cinerariifolium TaxID=118510 RepID=A0A699KU05_TANCI|nr:putative ribonuclease H-like domain-containing protein [Tanacetum cinerariifolium]
MNKKYERGIVVRNKARLVAQGHRQEKGIDYDKVFAPVARIEAIRIFLAFASFMGFIVYQIDVKSAFLYGKIEEAVISTTEGCQFLGRRLISWQCKKQTIVATSTTEADLDDKAKDDKTTDDTGSNTVKEPVNKEDQAYKDELDRLMSQEKEASDAVDTLRKESKQGCMDQRGATKPSNTNPVL